MDALTVIVPMYNAQQFVARSLATMRANAADGIRFVLVDDRSTDQTPAIVEAALPSMPYVTFLRNAQNLGVARSRNLAFEHVDSRWVTYLDVDDWYRPGHLTALLDAANTLDVDHVRTHHVRVRGTVRQRIEAPIGPSGRAFPAADGIGTVGEETMVNYPFLWAGIYDVTRIPAELFAFDEHLRTAADRPWFWRLHLHTTSFAVADLDGYLYRKDANPTALTQTGSRSALHFTDAYHRVFDHVTGVGTDAQVLKAVGDAQRICLWHLNGSRERYAPEIRAELLGRVAGLMARVPDDVFAEAADRSQWRVTQRLLLRRLRSAGLGRVAADVTGRAA